MVNLRVVAGSQFLEDLPGNCMVLHCACHRLQLPRASVDTIWLRTPGSELELWLSAKEMLGSRYSVALIHTGHLQHPHRRDLHGCATDLSVSSSAVAEDTMGHPYRFLTEHPVSASWTATWSIIHD